MSTDGKRTKGGATLKKQKSREVFVEKSRKEPVKAKSPTPVAESSDEDDEDESQVPLDDLEDINIDEDMVPKQKVEIDNKVFFFSFHEPSDSTIILECRLPFVA